MSLLPGHLQCSRGPPSPKSGVRKWQGHMQQGVPTQICWHHSGVLPTQSPGLPCRLGWPPSPPPAALLLLINLQEWPSTSYSMPSGETLYPKAPPPCPGPAESVCCPCGPTATSPQGISAPSASLPDVVSASKPEASSVPSPWPLT